MTAWRARLGLALALSATLAACSDPAPLASEPPPAIERPVLPLSGEQPVRVPRAALIERAGITGLYVLDDGRARFRMVKPGVELGANRIEIVSGLAGGETVVLGALDDLYDGRPVSGAPRTR